MYLGRTKDYTWVAVNTTVFLVVPNGDADVVDVVGSRRVVDSNENHMFVYYTDHEGLRALYMP